MRGVRSPILPWLILGSWTGAVLAICFLKDGLSPDNRTRLAIIAVLGLTLTTVSWLSRFAQGRPRVVFIATSTLLAAVVEGCYMISTPLHPSLRVTSDTTLRDALHNFGVDVMLTTPAYVVIFCVVWWLIRRYEYQPWQYAAFIPAGHALGDGQAFLIANPAMLLFLPYILLNYQAMSFASFLAVRPHLPGGRRSGWARFVVPLIALPLTYGVCGTVVLSVGHWLGFF